MMSKTKLLVVLVVVVSLGLASCEGSGPASKPGITVEDLTGVWKDADITQYLQFNEDGTYRSGSSVDSESPYEVGQFRLEGTLLTFIAGNEGKQCSGNRGSYQVELIEQGQLHFELQEDECAIRANFQPGFWEWVEP